MSFFSFSLYLTAVSFLQPSQLSDAHIHKHTFAPKSHLLAFYAKLHVISSEILKLVLCSLCFAWGNLLSVWHCAFSCTLSKGCFSYGCLNKEWVQYVGAAPSHSDSMHSCFVFFFLSLHCPEIPMGFCLSIHTTVCLDCVFLCWFTGVDLFTSHTTGMWKYSQCVWVLLHLFVHMQCFKIWNSSADLTAWVYLV